jgi:hypothetical protein
MLSRKTAKKRNKKKSWIVKSKEVPGDNKAFDITVRADNGEERQTRILAMRVI